MALVKKTIGRVPQNMGEWADNFVNPKTQQNGYGEKFRVILYGCEWESKIENNTFVPATVVDNNIVPDTTHWRLVTGRLDLSQVNLDKNYLSPTKAQNFTEEQKKMARENIGIELPDIVEEEYYVDMGLPSGTLWATRNIDVTQSDGFAASTFQYDCSFFSWGNVDGHNPINDTTFDYDWGNGNDGPYAQTPGAQLTGDIPLTHDAARVNCGSPWRMPSSSQFQELVNNCVFINADGTEIAASQTNKLVTVNDIVGIYLKSKINGNLLFFPCCGNGNNTSLVARRTYGFYWSNNLYSQVNGSDLIFREGEVSAQHNSNRSSGFPLRPIINPSDKTLHKVAVTGNYEDLVGKPNLSLKQNVITNGAQIGLGFGVSTEAATVSARTANIDNFMLLRNMPVTITFKNAINVMGATLNISSTGSKLIYINYTQLQAGIVKAGDVVTLVYDGIAWHIINILTVDVSPSDLYVDMGLPSGTKWAVANIDVTTKSGFAEVDGKPSPFKYECSFFSWGNTEGHNPISNSAFDYDWGEYNDGPYAQTPGAVLTADAGLSFDAARVNLGAPWRMPSEDDFVELFNNIDFVQADGRTVIDASSNNKTITVNGVNGIYLKSKINNHLLFFACNGDGYMQSLEDKGVCGYYWSNSLYSQDQGNYLFFYSRTAKPQDYTDRLFGAACRPVQ